MKKRLMIGMLTLVGTAGAATLPEIFSTSDKVLSAACNDGYRIESMPMTTDAEKEAAQTAYDAISGGKNVRDTRSFTDVKTDPMAKMYALVNPIDFQMPAGSVYNVCGKRASKLEDKPKVSTLSAATVVYVFGDAPERKQAESWNAILTAIDSQGREIARFQPLSASLKGSLDYWKPSCTSSGCKWVGRNAYYFKLGNLDAKTTKLKLTFTRGRGVEQREYTADDLSKSYLGDPKTP